MEQANRPRQTDRPALEASPDAYVFGITTFVACLACTFLSILHIAGTGVPTRATFYACGPIALGSSALVLVATYKLNTHATPFILTHAFAATTWVVLFLYSLRYD